MYRSLLAIACLLASICCFAEPIDSLTAIEIAQKFYASRNTLKTVSDNSSFSISYAATSKTSNNTLKSVASSALVYVVNGPQGFIVVSGDDAAEPILGYADETNFDASNASPEFLYWIGAMSNEIEALQTSVVVGTAANTNKSTSAAIEPLLRGTLWSQSTPFNNLCPKRGGLSSDRCAVGCVATAMSQIMYYHKWPLTGTGSNTYTTETSKTKLSASFANTTYDWDNMIDNYLHGYTENQAKAVATLSYHCGISVDMDYGEESSATDLDASAALISNFNYDKDLTWMSRVIPTDEWTAIILSELQAARPVLYCGQGTDGGHAFVCDGYDGNGFFHFNWGWGGMSNGYFTLSALTPGSQGIGGNSDGFNNSQSIIVGIQKDNNKNDTYRSLLALDNDKTLSVDYARVSRSQAFAVNGTYYNLSSTTFNGSMAIALKAADGTITVIDNSQKNIQSLKTLQGYGLSGEITIGSSIANGNYSLCCVYKQKNESSWHEMYCYDYWKRHTLSVTLTSTQAYFSEPKADLEQISMLEHSSLYTNCNVNYTFAVKNNGTPYSKNIGIRVYDENNEKLVAQYVGKYFIDNNDTVFVQFVETCDLEPGQYWAYTIYDQNINADSDNHPLYTYFAATTPVELYVQSEPESPELYLEFTNSDEKIVSGHEFTFKANVKNDGGFFYDDINLYLFANKSTSNGELLCSGSFSLETNTSDQIEFKALSSFETGEHYVVAYIFDNNSYKYIQISNATVYTQVADTTTTIRNDDIEHSVVVYPTPVSSTLYIAAQDVNITKTEVYSLNGNCQLSQNHLPSANAQITVSSLNDGLYLIRVSFEDGTDATKLFSVKH